MTGEWHPLYPGLEDIIRQERCTESPLDAVIGNSAEEVRNIIVHRLEMVGMPNELIENGQYITSKIVFDNWLKYGVCFPVWAIGLVKDENNANKEDT